MDIVTYKELKLYTNQKNILQPISVKQDDGLSRYLKITLMSDENVVELLDTDNVIINVKRSDNQSQAFSGTISDGVITVPIPAWLMEVTGRANCSVSCFRLLGYELSADTEVNENKTYYTESGGVYSVVTPVGNEDPSALGWYEAQIAKLSSNTFYIDVQEMEYSGDDIEQDENYGVLVGLIGQVEVLENNWTQKNLKFENVVANMWEDDTTYPNYPYKCELACTGVTSDLVVEVVFGLNEAVSGNYAPICVSGTDTVTIYSKVNTTITIPTIKVV